MANQVSAVVRFNTYWWLWVAVRGLDGETFKIGCPFESIRTAVRRSPIPARYRADALRLRSAIGCIATLRRISRGGIKVLPRHAIVASEVRTAEWESGYIAQG